MIKKNIPNAITCGNLLCGCLAITSAFHGDLIWAAYLVGIAAVLDFLDGFVARVLKVHSEIGKQLDSLADMVTFGVVPGVIMFHLIQASLTHNIVNTYIDKQEVPSLYLFLPYTAYLISIFSCIRLAKFNIDTRQSDSFIGVPTPANSILIASFPLIIASCGFHLANLSTDNVLYKDMFLGKGPELPSNWTFYLPYAVQQLDIPAIAETSSLPVYKILLNPYFLIGLTLLMSYLLIAELPLFALKFKNFKWKGNEIRFIFLGISLLLLILFKFAAIPFIIFLYIILSVINNIGKKKKEEEYDLIANK